MGGSLKGFTVLLRAPLSCSAMISCIAQSPPNKSMAGFFTCRGKFRIALGRVMNSAYGSEVIVEQEIGTGQESAGSVDRFSYG